MKKNTTTTVAKSKLPSDLQIPLFAAGQMLRHDDLAALANYTREITRLMLRSLFGCGVVCGLCVEATPACGKLTVTVEPGVALDCEGDIIHVSRTNTLTVDPTCNTLGLPECLWVVLRGLQKCCAPRPVACSPDDDEVASTCTREQYWYEIQVLTEAPECVCACLERKQKGQASGHDCDTSQSTGGSSSYAESGTSSSAASKDTCLEPSDHCYDDHKDGKCTCGCEECANCKCEWIMLARLKNPHDDRKPWPVEHRVRRFVRPELLQDRGCKPKAQTEEQEGSDTHEESETHTASETYETKPEDVTGGEQPAPKKQISKRQRPPRKRGVTMGRLEDLER
jgi:hypothetical protein